MSFPEDFGRTVLIGNPASKAGIEVCDFAKLRQDLDTGRKQETESEVCGVDAGFRLSCDTLYDTNGGS